MRQMSYFLSPCLMANYWTITRTVKDEIYR